MKADAPTLDLDVSDAEVPDAALDALAELLVAAYLDSPPNEKDPGTRLHLRTRVGEPSNGICT